MLHRCENDSRKSSSSRCCTLKVLDFRSITFLFLGIENCFFAVITGIVSMYGTSSTEVAAPLFFPCLSFSGLFTNGYLSTFAGISAMVYLRTTVISRKRESETTSSLFSRMESLSVRIRRCSLSLRIV